MSDILKHRFLWFSTWRNTERSERRSYQSFTVDLVYCVDKGNSVILDSKKISKTNWSSVARGDHTLPVIYLQFTAPGQSKGRFYVFEPVEITHGGKCLLCQYSTAEHQNFNTEVENYVAMETTTPNIYHITLTERYSTGPLRGHDHPIELCRLQWLSSFRSGTPHKTREIQEFLFLLNGVDTQACVVPKEWFYFYMPTSKQELLFIHTSTNRPGEKSRYYVFERIKKCGRADHYGWLCQHSTIESEHDAKTLIAYMFKYVENPKSFYASVYHIELNPIHQERPEPVDGEDDDFTSTETPNMYRNCYP